MGTIDYIREKIQALFEKNPNIHVSTKTSHPKVIIETAPAVICGVYKNIFRIEEEKNGTKRYHTVRYADVCIGLVEIAELS